VTNASATVDGQLPVVAHCCTPYLFATGSWIYSQLMHLAEHDPIVLTDRTENVDLFPFPSPCQSLFRWLFPSLSRSPFQSRCRNSRPFLSPLLREPMNAVMCAIIAATPHLFEQSLRRSPFPLR